MFWVPKILLSWRSSSCKVWTRFINYRNLEALGICLFLTADADMHPIQFFVAIGIEFGFNPKVMTNPVFCIFESFNDLSLTVFEYWNSFVLIICIVLPKGIGRENHNGENK